jgi:hypothetical protein
MILPISEFQASPNLAVRDEDTDHAMVIVMSSSGLGVGAIWRSE